MEAWKLCLLTVSVWLVGSTSGLDNGLVLTPPMGWLAWERFRCNTDCKNDPENWYAAAGYEYINVDDCWPERERGPSGELVADRERFPYGIKSLADYYNVDDCWPERERGPSGELVADRERFPYGIKSLADYVSTTWTTAGRSASAGPPAS
ncbi:Alpha-N-acetylgalactosaminidase, partial [Operophtera brumata]